MPRSATKPAKPRSSKASHATLSRDQLLDLYYWMRLTRTLEERLVALYRQTKVVGGLFRSLGQEADAVGSAYALERRDILSPLIRNLGAMLVKGATPVEIMEAVALGASSRHWSRVLTVWASDMPSFRAEVDTSLRAAAARAAKKQ